MTLIAYFLAACVVIALLRWDAIWVNRCFDIHPACGVISVIASAAFWLGLGVLIVW